MIPSRKPKISVVIPTRNRADTLRATLASLEDQVLPRADFEVIVVDNGSTDETTAVCAAAANRLGNLRCIVELTPGLHSARHAGMRAAASELLAFADDDIEALPSWLLAVVRSFEHLRVGMVGGNNLPLLRTPPPEWFESLWQTTPYGRAIPYYSILEFDETVRPIPARYIWGCNFSVRKSLVEKAGGFRPDGMPKELVHLRGDGESSLASAIVKLGHISLFNPQASVRHLISEDRLSFKYLESRGFAQGISRSYTLFRRLKGNSLPLILVQNILRAKIHFTLLRMNEDCPRLRMLTGYLKGFNYHQRRMNADRGLREWVLATSYLNASHLTNVGQYVTGTGPSTGHQGFSKSPSL
jgi:glycosyltransferase involved in cell wall biosynthesis